MIGHARHDSDGGARAALGDGAAEPVPFVPFVRLAAAGACWWVVSLTLVTTEPSSW